MRTLLRGAPALPTLLLVFSGTAAQETATWYIGTYSNDLLVWDEASEQVVDRITMRNYIPRGITTSASEDRLYVREASGQSSTSPDARSWTSSRFPTTA
jgi:hypothetical protein